MSIETLVGGGAESSSEQFSWVCDYDTAAETIGITLTGTGHATLTVIRTSNNSVLGAANLDQFGTTNGPLTNGASASPVTYDGTRKILLGPGATGVDVNGKPLSTAKVNSTVVGQVDPPKGTQPGLVPQLVWNPNG